MIPIPEEFWTLDAETYFDSKTYALRRLTVEGYVRSPRFQLIGWGIARNGMAKWTDGRHAAQGLAPIRANPDAILAHHAHFDLLVLSHHHNIRPGFVFDTLSMAREIHGVEVGGSLKRLAEQYKIGGKGSDAIDNDGMRLEDFMPEALAAYGRYCCNDVVLTRKLFKILRGKVGEASIRGIDLMVRMFSDPALVVDAPYLEEFRDWDQARKQELLRTASGLDPNADPAVLRSTLMSNKKFAAALLALGVDPPMKHSPRKTATAKKRADAKGLADPGPISTWAFGANDAGFKKLAEYDGPNEELVGAMIEARLAVKSTINETRATRLLASGAGGRAVPIYLKWYAAHTGRAGGGDKLNFQNMERVDPSNPRKGSLRKSLRAPAGQKLIVVDSRQIEPRMLAWVAEDTEMLGSFRRNDTSGGDIYSERGSALFGYPITAETHPVERRVAKGFVIGEGYGMGWAKFSQLLAAGMMGMKPVQFSATDAELHHVDVNWFESEFGAQVRGFVSRIPYNELLVHCAVVKHFIAKYRRMNAPTTAFWREMGHVLHALTGYESGTFGPGGCIRVDGSRHGVGVLTQPDGTRLQYPGLSRHFTDNGIEYQYVGRKGPERIHGCSLTENVVQWMSRAVVFDQALSIQDVVRELGGKVVLTVHDEVVAAVPEQHAQAAFDAAAAIMRTPPAWCADLPLDASGGISQSYGDAK